MTLRDDGSERQALLDERIRLRRQLAEVSGGGQSPSGASDDANDEPPGDTADQAEDLTDFERRQQLHYVLRERLAGVEAALRRLDGDSQP